MPKSKPTKSAMDMNKLIADFGTEEQCHEYLEELRWPDGVKCPRCNSDKISRIKARFQYDCDDCRYQFSVRVGTVFHDSKLRLWKWFLAAYMITHAKKGVASTHLQRMLGISYKSAWYLSHRIRSAMPQSTDKLRGVVEVDETWMGGKEKGFQFRMKGAKSKKYIIFGAVERNGRLRLTPIPDVKKVTLKRVIDETVHDDATDIMTDSGRSLPDLSDHNTRHHKVNHYNEEWARGEAHTNTIEGAFGLIKRAISGTHQHTSKKHLLAYLDERVYVYNNRNNRYIFRDTIAALSSSDQLTYQDLIN